jgi:hypothetical protein
VRRPDGRRIVYQPGISPTRPKTGSCKGAEDQGSFFRGWIGKLAGSYSGVSRLRANRSRLLRNLPAQRWSSPLAARSAGLPHDRARKPAQDAAWRNSERASEDLSDGRKDSPTRPCSKDPTTRKRCALVWGQVLDGRAGHVTPDQRHPASENPLLSSARALRCVTRAMDISARPEDQEWAMAALTRLTRGASSAVPHG